MRFPNFRWIRRFVELKIRIKISGRGRMCEPTLLIACHLMRTPLSPILASVTKLRRRLLPDDVICDPRIAVPQNVPRTGESSFIPSFTTNWSKQSALSPINRIINDLDQRTSKVKNSTFDRSKF